MKTKANAKRRTMNAAHNCTGGRGQGHSAGMKPSSTDVRLLEFSAWKAEETENSMYIYRGFSVKSAFLNCNKMLELGIKVLR